MIFYNVATKVLNTESFFQHNIAGLISDITFIVSFSQEKSLWWKEINTHTHTHARTRARVGSYKTIFLFPFALYLSNNKFN